jgi:hypothetical protein
MKIVLRVLALGLQCSPVIFLHSIYSFAVVTVNVFARSNTGVVGSNPTQGMGVCLSLFCVRV